MDAVHLAAIPVPLQWDIPPLGYHVEQERAVSITAGSRTDLFRSPAGDTVVQNSPRLLFVPEGDFALSARVRVNFRNTFDAGVLVIYEHETSWAKLCFEFSPQRQPMIVSVVTRGLSDDCNSVPINGNEVYLRIARIGSAFAFHYSTDGKLWHMVRHFTLDKPDRIHAGFSAQSPRGESCSAAFSSITYSHTPPADIRSGE